MDTYRVQYSVVTTYSFNELSGTILVGAPSRAEAIKQARQKVYADTWGAKRVYIEHARKEPEKEGE